MKDQNNSRYDKIKDMTYAEAKEVSPYGFVPVLYQIHVDTVRKPVNIRTFQGRLRMGWKIKEAIEIESLWHGGDYKRKEKHAT